MTTQNIHCHAQKISNVFWGGGVRSSMGNSIAVGTIANHVLSYDKERGMLGFYRSTNGRELYTTL